MDDRRRISLGERIRRERRFGIAIAVGLGASLAAMLAFVSIASAVAALAWIPILIALRELVDDNRTQRRAWQRALTTVPEDLAEDLILRGVARAVSVRVVAPYSLRECLAYRARFTGTRFGKPGASSEVVYAGEERERIADLVVELPGAKVLVDGPATQLACDARAGEGAPLREIGEQASASDVDVFVPMTRALLRRARHQELLLQAGDPVVVIGHLVADSVHRGTFRLTGAPILVLAPSSPAADRSALDPAKLPKVRAQPYKG